MIMIAQLARIRSGAMVKLRRQVHVGNRHRESHIIIYLRPVIVNCLSLCSCSPRPKPTSRVPDFARNRIKMSGVQLVHTSDRDAGEVILCSNVPDSAAALRCRFGAVDVTCQSTSCDSAVCKVPTVRTRTPDMQCVNHTVITQPQDGPPPGFG